MEHKIINGRDVLVASEGMFLTDGNHYCKKVMLEKGLSVDAFYEVPKEEYERQLEASDVLSDEYSG